MIDGGSGDVRRLLLIGHGRMGRLVESLAADYRFQITGVIDRSASQNSTPWPDADVAVDFSVAHAVVPNMRRLAQAGVQVVLGTTGWQSEEPKLRELVTRHGIGVVAAANFALGVNLFLALAERAGALMVSRPEFGAWIHELHHSAKRDAPSGTALALRAAMEGAGYRLPINIASTRAGSMPGTHTLGFDAPSETLTFTHSARDRSVFARGALEAARWIHRRQGWFTMRDVLGI
jgi:4-hydroxy-tetrahydrodipicolinate reductase